MDKDLVLEIIKQCDFLGDHANNVKAFIIKQAETIESLKCYGNCKNEVPRGNYTGICHGCIRSKQYQDPSGCIDNWQPIN